MKSSEVVRRDFEAAVMIYLAEDAATDGVDAQATKLIEDMMALTKGMNTLYRDNNHPSHSTRLITTGRQTSCNRLMTWFLNRTRIIMAGDINVTVRNVVQSARGEGVMPP